MNEQPDTLADALPREIKRVMDQRDQYLDIPDGAGMITAAMMRVSLQKAVDALASGDVIAMLRCHQDLKEYGD